MNERLVRTSLTRLARDRILRNERVGRRSVYSIEPASTSLFERAERRIYAGTDDEAPGWDGEWTLAVIDGTASSAAGRTELRRELAGSEWAR